MLAVVKVVAIFFLGGGGLLGFLNNRTPLSVEKLTIAIKNSFHRE